MEYDGIGGEEEGGKVGKLSGMKVEAKGAGEAEQQREKDVPTIRYGNWWRGTDLRE